MKKIIVIGAGIVGLACAYSIYKEGAQVTVIDRDPKGDKTSFGNAGSIAVMEVNAAASPDILWKVPKWMLDPLGPLFVKPAHAVKLVPWLYKFYQASRKEKSLSIHHALCYLNQRVYDDLIPMFQEVGLMDKLHRNGSLIVYESDYGFNQDKIIWKMRSDAGITVKYLSGEEARKLEPDLGSRVKHAVFCEQASYVSDPKEIVDLLRFWLSNEGITFIKDEVIDIEPSVNQEQRVIFAENPALYADEVVIAAGAWSNRLARNLGELSYVESERGYNKTLDANDINLSHEIIFAEKKFVMTPLSCGLRIGGTAEFGGLNNKPNFKRAEALVTLAQLYFPKLKNTKGSYWAGHRPSTPDSLPIISKSVLHEHIFYAFGHGHLGLTQSATTGKMITDIIFRKEVPYEFNSYSIQRFQS